VSALPHFRANIGESLRPETLGKCSSGVRLGRRAGGLIGKPHSDVV